MLRFDVLVCDLQPALEAAQLRVDAANIPQEDHQHVAAILFSGGCIGGGGLDTTADPPENIDLPRGAQISLERIRLKRGDQARARIGIGGGRHRPDHPLTDASPQPGRRNAGIDGREITGSCDAPGSAGFLNSFQSQLEIKVSVRGPLNQ